MKKLARSDFVAYTHKNWIVVHLDDGWHHLWGLCPPATPWEDVLEGAHGAEVLVGSLATAREYIEAKQELRR